MDKALFPLKDEFRDWFMNSNVYIHVNNIGEKRALLHILDGFDLPLSDAAKEYADGGGPEDGREFWYIFYSTRYQNVCSALCEPLKNNGVVFQYSEFMYWFNKAEPELVEPPEDMWTLFSL